MRELVRENPFGRIAFLDLKYTDHDGLVTCIATLEFGRDELPVGSTDYLVGFFKAMLILDSPGFRQIPESRFAAYEREPYIAVGRKIKSETSRSGDVSTGSTVDTAKLVAEVKASASAMISAKREVVDNTDLEQKIFRIRPRGEGMWDIIEIDGKYLDGAYILGKPLVQLSPLAGTNRKALRALVVVKQKDMVFEAQEKSILPTFGVKEKLLKIFSAKCMAKAIAPDQAYDGKFVMAASEISDEGL